MADIRSFYESINRQIQTGGVELRAEEETGIRKILERLSLERLFIENPLLSPLEESGFALEGVLREQEYSYQASLSVTAFQGGFDCLLSAKLMEEKIPFKEMYQTADFFSGINYYSVPLDLFDKVWLLEAVIVADTKEETDVPLFSFTVFYEEESLIYKYFKKFLPEAGEPLNFTGNGTAPFGQPHYVVEASFLKNITFPFYQGARSAQECRLVINSHAEGSLGDGQTYYRCRVGVRYRMEIPGLLENGVWMSVDFGRYGGNYYIYANFDEGLALQDGSSFITSMTGKTGLPDFPDWADMDKLPLKGIVMVVEQLQEGEQRLMGCAFRFALDLPDIPIPFFEKAEGGARAELAVQWNMLNAGGFLAVIAGFYGTWKGHCLKINITIPDLEFQGIYEQDENKKEAANGIFPGFMDLSIDYVRLYGYIPDNTYQMDFELANNNLHSIPIGKHFFQIDYITGMISYSPKGLQLAVELEFTLFTAIIQLEGIYKKEKETQLLTLKGGLANRFKLSELICLITGEELSAGSLDLDVSALYVTYQTELSEKETNANVLGTPCYFEFLCAIAFTWGDNNEVASSFHLQWENNTYNLWISAAITLFECFVFAASCQVSIETGDASFRNFKFRTKIRSIEVTAVYDAQKNFTFKVIDFNLGELIEGLVSVIAPDHNWYLPWPFNVLKQITLKELEIIFDRQKKTILAKYLINFKILFLTVEYIELFYDYDNGDFLVNVKTNGSVEASRQGVEERNGDISGTDEGDIYGLNILKDIFPAVQNMGDRLFSLKYLGIGQHISVGIPASFEETAFPAVLENMKKSIKKAGRPKLDMDNNWVAALQLKLINAIDLTLLMCDPVFYGLQVDIGKGSNLVEQLAGLSFTILYSKVTETVGMFYARLKFPEAFREIELGAIQLQLGEIAVWIYTDGNFKIDMGFPHNKDFSNSFGLTYLLFSGKGGFYFGLLNGDTSHAVPQVPRGHFEVVLELGIGISAGIGREISAGPLKARAYVTLVAIFEGVLANYVPAIEGEKDSVYYKVRACAGVTASIYGSVDFVLVKIGFSVNLSFTADLTLERYQSTKLSVELSVSVDAYIKIFRMKISFSFHFTWKDSFVLGEKSTPPWEIGNLRNKAALEISENSSYEVQWYNGAVVNTRAVICAEVLPYFTFDEIEPGKEASGKRKIAFLSLIHGMEERTCRKLGYGSRLNTPFAKLSEICFRRAVLSLKGEEFVDKQLLEYLYRYLSRMESFEEGFETESLMGFLNHNISIKYTNGSIEKQEDGQETQEIDGIPFPLFPETEFTWFSAPDITVVYDLGKEPSVGETFFADMQDYYYQLALWNEEPDKLRIQNGREGEEGNSASWFMFAQYFYMLTKIMVSLALGKIGEEKLSLDQAVGLISDEETMKKAAGMISRFSYGGSRVFVEGEGTKSIYDFAFQELDGLNPEEFADDGVIHRMSMKIKGVDDSLEWSFTKKELYYPEGTLQIKGTPEVLPFYRRQPEILELKNPKELGTGDTGHTDNMSGISFWESRSRLSGNFQVVSYEEGEIHAEYPFERGFLLQIPIKADGDDVFEIEPMGYEIINQLIEILDDEVLNITPYRYTNELDSNNCGFCTVDKTVFLYRSNLCLEAEKPILMSGRTRKMESRQDEKKYENSAYLTEMESFLLLLKDASMVNARGYYLKFRLVERHSLQEGRMKLVLWVQTREKAEGIKIIHKEVTKESHPVILTGRETGIYAYEPGTFAFYLGEEQNDSEIQERYQMLGYQILENKNFDASHESLPVIAQRIGEDTGYSQIVPAYRFAKGEEENPYGGIMQGSCLKMDFRLIDILGNRSSFGKTWEIPYGYTDPLLPISIYPHTQCTYNLERTKEDYEFVLTFRYVEEEQAWKEGDENLRLACLQLQCEDVNCYISLCGKETLVDKAPLLQYLQDMYHKKTPEETAYRLPFEQREEMEEIRASFSIKRSPELLSGLLKGSSEADAVLSVESVVTEDKEKINKDYLALRGRDGQVFFVPPTAPAFTGYEIWTLQPLSNKLLQLKDIPVTDEEGIVQNVSYYDVDLEVWAEDFLMDIEDFLKPDSIYCEDREVCEKLLGIKKKLARAIALGVTKISNGKSGEKSQGAAVTYYENLMLQNLYTGRELDGLILLQSNTVPPVGKAWCFGAKADKEGFTLKPGKIKDDGLLPVGIKVRDISKQMHMELNLQLAFTDWEIAGGEFYDFLTIQEQKNICQKVEGNLPYKRFPQVPVLIRQGYGQETGDKAVDGVCQWKYQISFSHQSAAQDMITLCVVPETGGKLRTMDEDFLYAMVQYRFLRKKLLEDTLLKDRLMECCENICDNWNYETMKTYGGIAAEEMKIRFALSFEEKKLFILETGIELENMEIAMKTVDGESNFLERGKGDFYILPDGLVEPFEFVFSVGGFDIRTVNRLNARLLVTRNQSLAEIDERFVYRCNEITFADELRPFLKRQEIIELGSFLEENFTEQIMGFCKGFGKAVAEVYCKAPVSLYGGEVIYSYLPVLYVPDMEKENRKTALKQIYKRIRTWLKERFDTSEEKNLIIQVNLTLFALGDEKRNLLELTNLEFLVGEK